MRKLLASIFALVAFAISSTAYAACDASAGFAAAANVDCQGQAQGQGQLQGQGQQQGQGQGQQQGMQQGQIGINKNYNGNLNKNYNKAVAVQGQLQGNKQQAKNTTIVKSDASGNAVAAYAPSISSRSTTNCITTYSGSGGGGGAGSASIFSLGLSVPIRDEDCVQEQAVRTGFESNVPEAQQLALELYRHQMATIMEKEGHITAASVLDADGNVQKVAYSKELRAFVPMEQHPKFQEAAATVFARAMLANGYQPNITTIGGSGFQTVSFPTAGGSFGTYEVNMDEDLIESVIGDIDDDNGLKVEQPDN